MTNLSFTSSFFNQPLSPGQVNFEIHHAKIKNLSGHNTICLDITLTDMNNAATSKRIPSLPIFVTQQVPSPFSQFMNEYFSKIQPEFNNPATLIGIKGVCNYYIGTNGYDKCDKWNFYLPSSVAHQQLNDHLSNLSALNPTDDMTSKYMEDAEDDNHY